MRARGLVVALAGLAALLAAGAAPAFAQAPPALPPGVAVTVHVEREGDTIADPVRLTVVVTHPPEGELLVPPPEGPLGDLDPAAPVVTRSRAGDGRARVTLVYETRAFATGLLSLTPPALSYRRDGLTTPIQPPAQIVEVRSLLPADGSLVPRGLKPAEEIAGAGFPLLPVALGGSIAALLIVAGLSVVWRRRRERRCSSLLARAAPSWLHRPVISPTASTKSPASRRPRSIRPAPATSSSPDMSSRVRGAQRPSMLWHWARGRPVTWCAIESGMAAAGSAWRRCAVCTRSQRGRSGD